MFYNFVHAENKLFQAEKCRARLEAAFLKNSARSKGSGSKPDTKWDGLSGSTGNIWRAGRPLLELCRFAGISRSAYLWESARAKAYFIRIPFDKESIYIFL